MMKMDADIVVMTTPDLDNFYLKRSYVRKDIEYIYIPHGMGSSTMRARKGCLDHFDTVLCADFQDPVELISRFMAEWEKGYKIVIGRKTSSRENRFVYFLRSCYYKAIKIMSSVEQIEHFTGFGLYDVFCSLSADDGRMEL